LLRPSVEAQVDAQERRDPSAVETTLESRELERGAGLRENRMRFDYASALDELGAGREFAQSEIAEARALGAQSRLGQEVAEASLNAGLPELQAHVERAGLQLSEEEIGHMSLQLARAQDWIKTLPEQQQGEYAVAMANPEFLRHLQFHENLDWQQRLAFMQMQQGAEEDLAARLSGWMNFQERQMDLAQKIQAAEDDGDDELAELYGQQLRNINLASSIAFPEFGFAYTDYAEGDFFRLFAGDATPENVISMWTAGEVVDENGNPISGEQLIQEARAAGVYSQIDIHKMRRAVEAREALERGELSLGQVLRGLDSMLKDFNPPTPVGPAGAIDRGVRRAGQAVGSIFEDVRMIGTDVWKAAEERAREDLKKREGGRDE
jgi:hypothetical protein